MKQQGNFLNTIGEKGGGPNEQLSIISFYINSIKKYIGIIDVIKQTVFKYSFNGVLLDKVRFGNSLSEFYNVDMLYNGGQLILTTYNEYGNEYEYILIDEESLKIEREYSPYIKTSDVSMKYGFPRVAFIKDTCFFLTQYSDIVQKYQNNKVNPYLLVKTHLSKINSNTRFSGFNQTGSVLDFNDNLIANNYSLGLEQIFATDNYLYLLYNSYHENRIYHIFRDIQHNRYFSIILDREFYKYPVAGIVSFENFLASTSNGFVTVFINREGFMDVSEDIIKNNESLTKIRSEFEEEGNPIIAFINIKQLLEDASKAK